MKRRSRREVNCVAASCTVIIVIAKATARTVASAVAAAERIERAPLALAFSDEGMPATSPDKAASRIGERIPAAIPATSIVDGTSQKLAHNASRCFWSRGDLIPWPPQPDA